MTPPEKRRERAGRTGLALFLLALVLSNLWSCAALLGELEHSLSNRPDWIATKTLLERDVIGSVSFAQTPLALAGDALNLGAWHGFQEVLFTEPIELERMRWRMRMPEAAWASALFDHDETGFSGFQLSRNPEIASVAFRSDAQGRFLESRAIDAGNLSGAWHDFEIAARGDEAALLVDAREVARLPLRRQPARVGFRGGMHDTYVDDVTIVARDQARAFHDSFEARLPGALRLGLLLALLVGMTAALAWVAVRGRPRGQRLRNAMFAGLTFNLLLLFAGGAALFVEEELLSARYGYATLHFKLRKKIEDPPRPRSSWRVVLPALREAYEGRPVSTERVFLIGSSQTWGSGASSDDRDIAGQLESRLRDRLAPRPIEVVNLAVSGKDSDFLYEHFEGEWSAWEPALVVINLGNNDADAEVFREKLTAFAKHDREHDVVTIFVLEANHPAQRSGSLSTNHQVMREVAAREGIPVVDLHSRLAERNGEGFLWWDFVHLSDFGQELSAEILADAVVRSLRPEADKGPS